eukprot:TRINITY_DN1307_c0_g3_i1.p1 TRINITY_DN1307_c0_g3~~TRINITY_DN1307_c0_g3_i1.p1  ORF type:complete len:105 (+),score=15.22 TRINITY_DN1307_c0_g3_i1:302-616(+)
MPPLSLAFAARAKAAKGERALPTSPPQPNLAATQGGDSAATALHLTFACRGAKTDWKELGKGVTQRRIFSPDSQSITCVLSVVPPPADPKLQTSPKHMLLVSSS